MCDMNSIAQMTINDWIEHRDDYVLVDVRSPKEYQEFHIPESINLPIFSNDERARVGTVFKQKGQEDAKELGIEIVSKKLPDLYRSMKELQTKGKRLGVYCWRGGMRSRSIVSVMNMMGIHCEQLKGGIRSFRKMIVKDLTEIANQKMRFVVIEGCTGSRKTDLLVELTKKDYPVIDLEGLAGHRGSIFGAVGMTPRSQKQFECDLWERLNELKGSGYYIIEGESKRIGNVILPPFIIEGKDKGIHLFIEYPFQKRIEAIYQTYRPNTQHSALYEAFTHLQKYMQPRFIDEIEMAFEQQDYRTLIGILLEHYYDPKYLHKIDTYQTDSKTIIMDNLEEGLLKIEDMLEKLTIYS